MSTPTNTEEEKTIHKRSSTEITERDDDEFILNLPKKPKTVTGANGMDYLDVETYEQLLLEPYQPSIGDSEDEIISVLDIYIYMVIPTIAIDSSEAEKEKCLANLAAKENTLMKYADKIKFFRYLINNQMRDLNKELNGK